MARIPTDQLERIKQEISLLDLIEHQGHKITKQGKDYAVCCPFHEDKTPSCIISVKSNLFNCFGCGTGGSVIDWVMKTEGKSFREAAVMLQQRVVGSTDLPTKKTQLLKSVNPITQYADNHTVIEQVIDYYHATLKAVPDVMVYLKKRGLDSAELIDHFKLGYANRTLGKCIPKGKTVSGSKMREQLKAIGLFTDTGFEHFNGSLVIPVINTDGLITEIYGRKTVPNLRKGTPQHTYLPGPHIGVFNASCLAATDEVILCEALIDALTFWRWGFKHVTSSYGVNGFTDELLQALIDNKIKRVLIAYDHDEAGNRAAEKVVTLLNKNTIEAYRVQFPKGMDANAYALHVTPPEKSLGLVLRKAELLGQSFTQNKAETPTQENVCITETKNTGQPASPLPLYPADVKLITQGQDNFMTLGARIYRVRGLEKNTDPAQLKIQLMVRTDDLLHVDKLDLSSSKQRQVFINQASVELGVKDDIIKKDLGKVLLALEDKIAALSREEAHNNKKIKTLGAEEHEQALALLKDPALFSRILEDFQCAGIVGEESNKLVGYLACVSRKLDKPLAVIIQSSSAAGKSSLMDSILRFIPEEDRIQYSAMSGQSLFYMGETDLKHKILAIAEEEGASNASYALKLLQSDGEVTMASTGKDDNSGNLVTRDYKVEGPVMLFLTTTAIDIDEELLNRCIVLSVNEGREQTEAIHKAQRQRRTLDGLQKQLEKDNITELHHNAQRLLKPLIVINPYAEALTFLSDKTRTRRDHEKYLTLIDSIALLHQHQRDIKTHCYDEQRIDYIEVELSDIDKANVLAHAVLGRTLDELPPQTRKLLSMIQNMVETACKKEQLVQQNYRFSRRQVRECCGWSETQVRVHMQRLMDLEYLLTHRGGRGQSFEYELLYQGEGDQHDAFVMGLLDIKQLKEKHASGSNDNKNKKTDSTTESSRGSERDIAVLSRPQRGGNVETENALQPLNGVAYSPSSRETAENASC